MKLRRWLTNPVIIFAAIEFAIIVAVIALVLTRK
jgi:hypothetical protein